MKITTPLMCAGAALALAGCGNEDPASELGGEQSTAPPQAEAQNRTQPQAAATGEPGTAAEQRVSGTETTTENPESVTTTLIDPDGNEVGSVIIYPLRQGVRLDLHAEGLQPGTHAVHFHETGRCETPDFASAGGHYNPTDAEHGMPDSDEQMDEQDHHAGDMLNQTVEDNGMLDAQMVNATVTIEGTRNALLDDDGSALVIHAKGDDYESQPSGAAGSRVACAEINRA